eukprot:TRINITY_DN2585_c0_g1_i4.p1 TRINITY_DN2585_c0_g1~~TRINITY_DN2585_c0_g1_i4.p1  ORF type:complete len:229 (-),score=20.89 TRINITY_DN2585_c0_g1_i4:419-1105(-)
MRRSKLPLPTGSTDEPLTIIADAIPAGMSPRESKESKETNGSNKSNEGIMESKEFEQKTTDTEGGWIYLPIELIEEIVSLLEAHELCSLGLSCKHYHAICSSHPTWDKIILDTFPSKMSGKSLRNRMLLYKGTKASLFCKLQCETHRKLHYTSYYMAGCPVSNSRGAKARRRRKAFCEANNVAYPLTLEGYQTLKGNLTSPYEIRMLIRNNNPKYLISVNKENSGHLF